jgi:CubicO group peptidase (beta-lactamase class C family)
MRTARRLIALCLLVCPAASQGGAYFPPPESSGGWRSLVTPNQVPSAAQRASIAQIAGMDADGLVAAKDLLVPYGVGSFLVIRRGWVVLEWGPTGEQHIASCTKSLTAMALMRILDLSDELPGVTPMTLETPAWPYLPSSWLTGAPTKADIRLEHLLSMSSGLAYHDSPMAQWAYSATVIAQPMANVPGTVWTYSSQPVDLLSVMVQHLSDKKLRDFFLTEIGTPIGMAPFTWKSMGPYTLGSAFAYIAPRDVARPMYLLFQDGEWDGQQVLSSPRAQLLLTRSSIPLRTTYGNPNSPFVTGPTARSGYGHLFWTNASVLSPLSTAVPPDAVYMAGAGTRFVVGIPSEDLIVVRLGSGGPDPFDGILLSGVVSTVVEAILPESQRTRAKNGRRAGKARRR